MMPNMNPKHLKHMMKQMGMSSEDIPATEVIIRTPEKLYKFEKPQVQKIQAQGQASFQISGSFSEQKPLTQTIQHSHSENISEEDIKVVSEQAGVSTKEAKDALNKANGDIAQAIVNITK